jgi:hypothetical protein
MALTDGYDHMVQVCQRDHVEKVIEFESLQHIQNFSIEIRIFCNCQNLKRMFHWFLYLLTVPGIPSL